MRPGKPAMVGGMGNAAEREIGAVGSLDLSVQKYGLLVVIAVPRPANEAGIFRTGHIGDAVGPGSVRCRNGGIILLDPATHLLDQRLAQFRGAGHDGILIGILRDQMIANLRVEHRRVLEHVLPVWRAQPGVFVRTFTPVADVGHRTAFGLRRCGDVRRCLGVGHRACLADVSGEGRTMSRMLHR